MFSRLALNCACHKTTRLSTKWRALALNKRLSSTSHTDEIISIPVGGSGVFNLKISRPKQTTRNNNVLVYLPPGPLLESCRREPPIIDSRTLRDAFPDTTIVDLRYRVSLREEYTSTRSIKSRYHQHSDSDNENAPADHRFPTPIHDVFTAWDYITDSLQLYNHITTEDGKEIYYTPRICLVGSHIGGALALSLALTNPNVISAVAVVDVLGDWTGLDELSGGQPGDTAEEKKKSRNVKKNNNTEKEKIRAAAKELLRLRERLFRSHSGYFDAFASPVLFLRAPGRDTPVEGGDVGINGVVVSDGEELDEVRIVEEGGSGNDKAFGPYDDDWLVSGYEEAHGLTAVQGQVGEESELLSACNRQEYGHEDVSVVPREPDANTISSSPSSSPTETVSSVTSIYPDQDSTDPATIPQTTPTPSPQSPHSISDPSQPPSSPRRRKVLRRWPPIAQPEDVLLPYMNLFTTSPPPIQPSPSPSSPPSAAPETSTTPTDSNHDLNTATDISSPSPTDITRLTTLQSQELQDLLRKACFWGREKSFAEERVVMTRLGEIQDEDSGPDLGLELEEHDGLGGIVKDKEQSREQDREMEREQVVKWLRMRFETG